MQAARGAPLTGPEGGSEAGQPSRRAAVAGLASEPRRISVLLAVAVVVLALDIAAKVTVVAKLSGGPLRLLGGFLTLRVSRNPGAAFSIGTSQTILFTAIAVGVIIFILRASRRIRSLPWAVALGLLLGGATGNLTDRIFRYPGLGRGYVVDWIQVPHWPVFNLADSAICCGGVLAVLLATRGIGIDGSRAKSARDNGGKAAGRDEVPGSGGEVAGPSGEELAVSGGQPGPSDVQPAAAGDQRAVSGDQPEPSGDQSALARDQRALIGDQPAVVGDAAGPGGDVPEATELPGTSELPGGGG
jgi:signal peptidase II